MKKTRNSFSLTIILTMMLLACLLMVSLGSTGAWFSATGSVLKFQINLSGADIYVYQTLNGNDIKIDPSDQSVPPDPLVQPYLKLEQEIVPGEEVPLALKLDYNEASGSYLRFKFEVFALGQTNTKIPVLLNIVSVDENQNGFQLLSDSYFCYYKWDSDSKDSIPEKIVGDVNLISGFTIEESDFADSQLNGNTIKIVLTVECSDINWYA